MKIFERPFQGIKDVVDTEQELCLRACVHLLSFEYNACVDVFRMHKGSGFSNGNVRAKHVSLNVKLLPFPFPRSCHSVMWAPSQMFFLISTASNLWCLCLRAYMSERVSPDTREHVCICFTYVPPCETVIHWRGVESALCGPYNAQTFFQLASQVELSDA